MLKIFLLCLSIGLTLAEDDKVLEKQPKDEIKIEPYSIKKANETDHPKLDPYSIKKEEETDKPKIEPYSVKKGNETDQPKIEPYSIKKGNETDKPEIEPYTNNSTLEPMPRGKCGKCGRRAYCHRKSGRCRCRWGYRGNPYKGCWRRVQWKCGKCGRRAYCHRRSGRCRCPGGYRGNPYTGCWRNVQWFQVAKATVCENKKKTIHCHWRKVINVYHVKYGRDNKHTCKSESIKTTKCSAKGATGKLKKACNGKRRCVLHAHNSVFGDPCVGTYKFLRVYYSCRRACSRNGFFKRGRCKCKKGFKGNGYWCRKVKHERRKVDPEDLPLGRRPIGTLPDPEYSDRFDERDTEEEAGDEIERRTAQGAIPASRRPTGIFPEADDSEQFDTRGITDDDDENVRVKREEDEDESEDVTERDVQADDEEDDESSDVLTTRDLYDTGDEDLDERSIDDERNDLAIRATEEDNEEVVDVSRRARPYCGKFGKVRGGKCKCNKGFCKNRNGKCVVRRGKRCQCNRGAEKRGKHGRCVCRRGYKRNEKGKCV